MRTETKRVKTKIKSRKMKRVETGARIKETKGVKDTGIGKLREWKRMERDEALGREWNE